MGPVDAAPADLETVRRILREHAPGLEARAFGSRVSWTARETSDLDLALMTDEPLDAARMAALRSAFTDSRLPFRVDVVDWAGASDGFREAIESGCVTLVGKGERGTGASWKATTLGDCIRMNDSTYSPKEAWPFVNYLDTGNVTENRVDGIHRLIPGKDEIPSRARRKARPGDILYSTVRPNQKHFGLLKEVPENFLASTGFSVFRGKADVAHTDFIYWFLAQDHVVERLHTIAEHSTSAYPSIRPSDIEELTLALPPLPEQRAIAGVLGALDDKIGLYRRMNETLEAMARTLFKSWFVDFDPVRARAEGRDTGLPGHIAALFPDRLVDSELGEIPEGWAIYRLDELAEHHTLSVTPSNHPETVFEHFSIPAYDRERIPALDRGEDIKSNKTVVPSGAVLLSKLNPEIPRVWIPGGSDGGPQICSTEFLTFVAREPASRPLLFCLFMNVTFGDILRSMVTGTSRSHQRVPAAALKLRKVMAGTPALFRRFGELAGPMLERVAGNRIEAWTLATLRDTLLPKLVSGEVRLGEVVERLESAA